MTPDAARIVARLLSARVEELRWERDQAILLLADRPPSKPGEMLNRIRDLGMGEMAFYRRLNELLYTERALAGFPVTVPRLSRIRDARAARRRR